MSQKYVHINGQLIPYEQATAPLYDHSLLYGDGAFEGIRTYNGNIFKLDEHLTRLYHSANALAIELPISQETMRQSVIELCRANEHMNGYIRMTITRGSFLGLDPKHYNGPANVYISNEQLTLYPKEMYENGLKMITVSTRIPPSFVFDPRIKSTGKYVSNIQAKMEANRAGVGEGLMLNMDGYVAECTGDNIFIICDGAIKTPPPSSCGLVGITRCTVIELARSNGIPVEEVMLTLYDIYSADECFLTGTGAEVIPAAMLDGRRIGSGKPGPVTHRVIELFHAHTQESGVSF